MLTSRVFNIHGLTGEHVWLSGSGVHIPWTSSKFSFSVPQLFDDGVDEKRFGEVAKDLLDHVAAEVGEENQDVSPKLFYLSHWTATNTTDEVRHSLPGL
jgi:hypothetical protein